MLRLVVRFLAGGRLFSTVKVGEMDKDFGRS